jgi:hypothetical protein
VIEKDAFGGTRFHRGCYAVRAMRASSRVFRQIAQSTQFGIGADLLRSSLVDWMKAQRAASARLAEDLPQKFGDLECPDSSRDWKWGAWRTIAGYEAIHMIRKGRRACSAVGEGRSAPSLYCWYVWIGSLIHSVIAPTSRSIPKLQHYRNYFVSVGAIGYNYCHCPTMGIPSRTVLCCRRRRIQFPACGRTTSLGPTIAQHTDSPAGRRCRS